MPSKEEAGNVYTFVIYGHCEKAVELYSLPQILNFNCQSVEFLTSPNQHISSVWSHSQTKRHRQNISNGGQDKRCRLYLYIRYLWIL